LLRLLIVVGGAIAFTGTAGFLFTEQFKKKPLLSIIVAILASWSTYLAVDEAWIRLDAWLNPPATAPTSVTSAPLSSPTIVPQSPPVSQLPPAPKLPASPPLPSPTKVPQSPPASQLPPAPKPPSSPPPVRDTSPRATVGPAEGKCTSVSAQCAVEIGGQCDPNTGQWCYGRYQGRNCGGGNIAAFDDCVSRKLGTRQ
jgi:hypothetical protein